MIESVLKPKEPSNPAWKAYRVDIQTGFAAIGFYHERLGLRVISAIETVEPEIGPEYHLSVSRVGSKAPRRCSADEARMVLKQFDAEAATEDNHSPVIRNYWLPVDESLQGIECECKPLEAAIVEGDFEWRPLTQTVVDKRKRGMFP
ncbi:MAG: hypothetical protein CMJ75_19080 [Planctomycetaceae bacterium]|nr:hypothetical protein [Planctomycetaceae bacterium]